MNFKRIMHYFFLSSLIALLFACSDEANEARLVNLHTTAAEDVLTIEFPAATETVVSINSETPFSVQGVKSNGVDRVSLTSQIDWSLSNGALSTIDKHGRLTAGPTAESITVYAKLGILSSSIDIRVSAARFNRVIKLNPDDKLPINIEMCQSQAITPIGEYIDDFGGVEIRKVDNTVIDRISWIISPSQSAYIETAANTTTLYSLSPGNLIVQAKAISDYSGVEVTSDNLSQTIGNGLTSVKICSSSTTDYAGCSNVTSASVDQGQQISFMAIAYYENAGTYQNITHTSKWGISNSNMTADFSNMQQIDITGAAIQGEATSTASTLSLACGDITQTVPGDITRGIILDEAVACNNDTSCKGATADITIKQLSVSSLEVFANDNKLSDDSQFTLELQPDDEIVLKVSAIYSNSSEPVDITENENLIYEIKTDTVIKQKDNTPGTYTILTAGTAKIVLSYRGKTFIVNIEIPEAL